MLELIAKAEEPPTLNELMAQLELAKATTHRFASLLERLGFVRRTADGKRYEIGGRLAALGLHVMRNASQFAPRQAVLSSLVSQIQETCNITTLDGGELIYLDRVESDWPLQIRLNVGSRVPLHCTASGKLFLALSPSLSEALLHLKSLPRHTSRTITDPAKLATELNRIRQTRIGTDNEEFIEGMAAAAVPVLGMDGRILRDGGGSRADRAAAAEAGDLARARSPAGRRRNCTDVPSGQGTRRMTELRRTARRYQATRERAVFAARNCGI